MRLPRARRRTETRSDAVSPRVRRVVGELERLAWQVCGLKSVCVQVDPTDDSVQFIDRRTGPRAALTRYGFTTHDKQKATIRRFESAEIAFLRESWARVQEYYGGTLLEGFQGTGAPPRCPRRGSPVVQGGRPESKRDRF